MIVTENKLGRRASVTARTAGTRITQEWDICWVLKCSDGSVCLSHLEGGKMKHVVLMSKDIERIQYLN